MSHPSEQENQPQPKTVTLRLSEHDAYQLFRLVQREVGRCIPEERPYWERQARKIQESIERAGGR